MAAPFYGAVRAAVSAAPGTGSISPGAASAGSRAWSAVPGNVIVDYRADDSGGVYEKGFGFWNGATLTRTPMYGSAGVGPGSPANLSSAATVSLIISEDRVAPHIGMNGRWMLWATVPNNGAQSLFGFITTAGTVANGIAGQATGSFTNRQNRSPFTCATAANSQTGFSLSNATVHFGGSAGLGGFEFNARWSVATLNTGQRYFVGFGGTTFSDPSTQNNRVGFMKDAADANLFFYSKGIGSSAKIDTGIPFAVDAFFETAIWALPGDRRVFYSVVRHDTGQCFHGVITDTAVMLATDTATTGNIYTGNGTNTTDTALIHIQSAYVRQGV